MAGIVRVSLIVGMLVLLAAGAAQARPAAPAAPSPAPRVWASKVCSSVATWQKQIQKRAAGLGRINGTSLPAIRGQLVKFLSGIVTDTDALVTAVDRAGTPAVPHGTDVRKAFHAGLVKTRSFFAADVRRAKRLPVSSPTKFTAGVTSLGRAIDTQARTLTTTFGAIEKRFGSTQLSGAMKPVAACSALG